MPLYSTSSLCLSSQILVKKYFSQRNENMQKQRKTVKENQISIVKGFPSAASGKESNSQSRRLETRVRSQNQEDPLEEGMATHSSIVSWRISWTEEPGGLQSVGSQIVRHD